MLTADEKRALLHAKTTVRHDKDGDCYYVGLPKTYDGATLPNNYGLASTMLQRQLKKFAHQPELAKNFADQMQIYCDFSLVSYHRKNCTQIFLVAIT